MLHFVYDEVDPRTDTPFYVGITNDPNKRHAEHLRTHDLTNEAKNRHIKRLLAEGITPKMRILEVVYSRAEAHTRERHWIQSYHTSGIELLNIQLFQPQPEARISYPREPRHIAKPTYWEAYLMDLGPAKWEAHWKIHCDMVRSQPFYSGH